MDSNPGISLFQGGSINVENALHNQEEEEDLEDQRRRQEEIQSLLTKAMDEFNFDDQSTINSSTNVSVNDYVYEPQVYKETLTGDEQRYKDAAMEDQIKVLYEVRVREVKALAEQLEAVKEELKTQKNTMGRRLMLVEAEKDGLQMSLKQSQGLLVEKNDEINKLQKESYSFKTAIIEIEQSVQSLSEEREYLKRTNMELHEQLTIMQNGMGTNTISERQIQENLRSEISKLQHSLENALMKQERQENENKDLAAQIRMLVKDKDELMLEKSDIINKLTESLEDSQSQCRELMQLIDSMSKENQKLKRTASNFEATANLQAGLTDKTEIIKVLQKELEKSHDQHSKHLQEFEKLQKDYAEISKNSLLAENQIERYKNENKLLTQSNDILKDNLKTQYEEILYLKGDIQKNSNLQTEKEILQKRIDSLQVILQDYENKNTREHSVQVSQIMTSFCEENDLQKEELQKMQQALLDAQEEVAFLSTQLSDNEEEMAILKTKISLEEEREKIIEDLQEKAAQFQQIILEKQTKPSMVSFGVNTDEKPDEVNAELLQAKFETEMIEKEIEMRQQIHREYEAKLGDCNKCLAFGVQVEQLNQMLQSKIAEMDDVIRNKPEHEIGDCAECGRLHAQVQQSEITKGVLHAELESVKVMQQQDREVIVKVLEEWKGKFVALETRNQELENSLQVAGEECVELRQKLKIREDGDAKLQSDLQNEAQALVREWNQQAIEGIHKLTMAHMNKIQVCKERMDNITKKSDKKVREIEQKYSKCRKTLEKRFVKPM